METNSAHSIRAKLIGLFITLALPSLSWAHSVSLHEAKLYEVTRFQRFELSSLKGKKFLLVFFQPDCPPCREQMKALKCLKEKYANVNVVAAGIGETAVLTKEIRPLSLNYTVVESTAKFQEMVDGITSTPTTFYVAESGFITGKETGTRTCDDWVTVAQQRKLAQ